MDLVVIVGFFESSGFVGLVGFGSVGFSLGRVIRVRVDCMDYVKLGELYKIIQQHHHSSWIGGTRTLRQSTIMEKWLIRF